MSGDLTPRDDPGQGPIGVMIVDDHELVRAGIRQALRQAEDLCVVGEAGDGVAALAALETHDVDVLLLDIRMPRLDGLGCLDQVVARWPKIAVLMLSVDDNRGTALEALRRGATGYVLKSIRPADLASAIRQAADGTVLMGGARMAEAMAPAELHTYDLTPRECEILALVAKGTTNAVIAANLHVAPKTVKYHLTSVFAKLGVSNRTEAATFAVKHHLCDD